LGLKNKGHLGVGADADVAIYEMDQDKQKMFSKPAYVIKNGEIVVKDRKIVSQFSGKTFLLDLDSPSPDEETTDFFNKYYSMDIENYPVGMEYLPSYEVVECR
jgi:formylmethanofuran dehydrogenase subunit A